MSVDRKPQMVAGEPVEFFGGPQDGTVIHMQPGRPLPRDVALDGHRYTLTPDQTGWRYLDRGPVKGAP